MKYKAYIKRFLWFILFLKPSEFINIISKMIEKIQIIFWVIYIFGMIKNIEMNDMVLQIIDIILDTIF